MHQNNNNDYRLQNNPPEENTCHDLYNKSSGRVPEKVIWPNEPETTIKNKREQILCGLQPELETTTRKAYPFSFTEVKDAVTQTNVYFGTSNESSNKIAAANIAKSEQDTDIKRKNRYCDFCNQFKHLNFECRARRREIRQIRKSRKHHVKPISKVKIL